MKLTCRTALLGCMKTSGHKTACNSCTWEGEEGELCEFQASQEYIGDPVSSKKTKKIKFTLYYIVKPAWAFVRPYLF